MLHDTLPQLAAAVFPWDVLYGVVEGAVAAATEALINKVRLDVNVFVQTLLCIVLQQIGRQLQV